MRCCNLIFSVLLIGMISGCTTMNMLGDFNIISPTQEKQLGVQLSGQIAKDSHVLRDAEINNYVRAIGNKLVAASMKPGDKYTFHVVYDKSVNAFAIPGGHLYVHTGLITAAENEAELAAVMAHELGHAESRHPTKSMSRAMGMQMISSMVLGKEPGQMQSAAANLLTNGGISAYSRSAENEADSIAVYLLNRCGYDPHAMVAFFEKLLEIERREGGGSIGMSLFASHPDTVDRINQVKLLIQSFGAQRASGLEMIGEFKKVKNKVKSLKQVRRAK